MKPVATTAPVGGLGLRVRGVLEIQTVAFSRSFDHGRLGAAARPG
jgi:hypothetical protein